ncbi:MAG: phytanoyl-CoA dioxygenase family protein [Planctomycetota bacterium]|nr:phytanoyl-CoA dioxygenase family protein [Planctomycetota bacterium]
MKVPFGAREFEIGGQYLDVKLRDSNALMDDVPAMHARFAEDGYLLFRNLIDRAAVLEGRQAIVTEMAAQGTLKPGTDPMEAIPQPGASYANLMGRKPITHQPAVRNVLENKNLFGILEKYFQQPVLTYDYKWLRAVRPPDNTGAHFDVVYMGRGTTTNLRTCWIPFGDVPIEHGTLALCVGSHRLPGFQKMRETYGKMDVDRDRVKGWFSNDPAEFVDKCGGKWQTTNFSAGDVLIFGMYTLHAALNNTSDRYRISCDVRYQPAADPVDDRWIGENPKAHYAWYSEPEKMVDMAELRAKWGV